MSFVSLVGLLGIVLALVLFLILTYKGFSPFWTAPVCAIVVAVFNLIGPVDTINAYLGGVTNLVLPLFCIIFGGAVLGKVFSDTGAAESIASTLIKKLVLGRTNPETQVKLAILVILIISALCTMGGIDGYVLTFTIFPICVVVASMVDIPRRFLPAMICLNVAFMAAPGAPQINNIMAKAGLLAGLGASGNAKITDALANGYTISSLAAWIPGLVGVLIITLGGYFTLTHMILRAKRAGEHFDWGHLQKVEQDENKKLPPFIIAILPLVVVFFLFTILPIIIHQEVHIMLCLGGGIIVDILLMSKYIPKKDERGQGLSLGKAIVNTLNKGAGQFPNAFLTIVTPAALAGVIVASSAFGALVGKIYGIDVNFMVLTLISVCVLIGITSSPPAAMMIVMPIIITVMLKQGMSADLVLDRVPGIARVAAMGASTFETLPFNGLIMLTIGLAGSTHKLSYKPQLYMTVVWTTIGAIVTAALIVLFPGIA